MLKTTLISEKGTYLMKKLTLCVAAALAVTAANVSAEEAPPYENWVGVFGQYYSADRMKNPPMGGLTDGKAIGGEVGFRFDPSWAIRFELSRLFIDGETDNPFAADDDGTQMGVDMMYFLEDDQAYLFGGLREQSLNTANYRMLTAGVGKHWDMNDNIRLITELAAYHDFGQKYHEYSAKVGIAYTFGNNPTYTRTDSDNDGVYDGVDRCPSTPAGTQIDETGCAIDKDGDGVINSADQCPMTPAGAKVDAKGCEAVVKSLDADNDGVLDSNDKCLDTPADVKVDAMGCTVVERRDVSVKIEILFPNNSSVVTNPNSSELQELATFMKRFPSTEAVVEGHSSSVGDAQYNLNLSKKRAYAVRKILINDFGLDASRVEAVGYGETRLKDTGDNAAAHRANRRIQVKVTALVDVKK